MFGAGRDGREALDFFGVDRVFCYVDNDPDRLGTIFYEKKIIFAQDLKRIVVYPCEQESILEIYKYQLDWMIRHTNASVLKPTEGKMRETQMKCLSGLKWLLQKVNSLDLSKQKILWCFE